MAKRLYEEESVRAIAAKIRSLVPSLYKRKFTVSEIPDGVERVYKEGETVGKAEGYREGYNEGYNKGYAGGSTTGYNKGYNHGESEGYSKGYNTALSSIPRAEGVGF